ncbi:phenylacetate-CoA oxygenase subunit PaaJ [Fodinisporobacter ferrooxydans]|uniref:Phenylacetate-CoA oxygenase subunit PaaJ n=1 Tax=Fodinisporobacter ferrooxydans TaxID=2901836 RepID=A0ABY4CPT6_9BACL|nr:phenylacetate-CoA oxygenase subunit PaaJ [Alicyclobacillaceae bacterium MYW30-H2]
MAEQYMEASTQTETSIQTAIWECLQEVKDPEIPAISMVEMGMIGNVRNEDGVVTIDVLPTFVGCPALQIIKNNIAEKVKTVNGVREVRVNFVFEPAWSSDRISDEGREKLKQFGIAAPPRNHHFCGKWEVKCPYCGSPYTKMENLFGPTACRSILYCNECKNPFEAMKPV